MASTTDDFIQALCPALYNSSLKSVYLEIAEMLTSSNFFGAKYSYAVALRACHNFTLDKTRPDGTAGLITGKTEGRLSINYWNEVPKGSNTDLHMTTYGKRLRILIHTLTGMVSTSNTLIDMSTGTLPEEY